MGGVESKKREEREERVGWSVRVEVFLRLEDDLCRLALQPLWHLRLLVSAGRPPVLC